MSSPFSRDFVKILGTKFSSRPSKETETIRGGTFHETKSFPFARPRRCSAPCSRAARGRRPARLRRAAAIRSLRPRRKRPQTARCRVVAVSESNTLLLADVDSERGDIYTLDASGLPLYREPTERGELLADGQLAVGCAGRGRLRRRYFGELSRIVRRGGAHHRPAGRI